MNERMKRIGVMDRRVIVPRQTRGPKSSVYGDNVKRYGLGEHPTKEEREAIKAEDSGKNSVNTEAGLDGKKFARGERAPKESEKVLADVDKSKSINEIAGLGGERSGAGEKIDLHEDKDVAEDVEEITLDVEKDAEFGIETENAEKPEEETKATSAQKPADSIPHPVKVLEDFFESLTIAKLKKFGAFNNLDFGDVRLKADYIKAATNAAENNLPNSIMGRTPDIDPGDYILYLFEGCGLKIDDQWLPKAN